MVYTYFNLYSAQKIERGYTLLEERDMSKKEKDIPSSTTTQDVSLVIQEKERGGRRVSLYDDAVRSRII